VSSGKPGTQSSSTSTAVLTDIARTMPVDELLARAVTSHQEGRLDLAEAAYQDVLARQPRNADALQFLGVLCHQTGDSEKAIRLLTKALKSQPKNYSCHNNLGSIYSETGDFKKAEFHFRKAVKSPEVGAEAWANLAQLQRRQGKDEEALGSCAWSAKTNPGYAKPHSIAGQIYTERQEFPKAEAAYREFLALEPNDVFAGNNLGYAMLMQGRFEEAERQFSETLERAGNSPEVSYNMRFLLMREGKLDEAREMFREQLRANPDNWTSELGLALGLAVRGSYSEALRNMLDILDLFPKDVKVWGDVAKVLTSLEKFEDAIEVLKTAAEFAPDCAGIHNNLGASYVQINLHGPAVHHLRKAIALEPDNIGPYLNICRALRGVAEFDQANFYGRATFDLESYKQRHFPGLQQVFRGTCDYEYLEKIGDPFENARAVRTNHLPTMLLDLLVAAERADEVQELFALVRRWAAYAEDAAEKNPLVPCTRGEPGDKLRIGFLSADLRQHSVSRFLTPLMRNYDKDRFEFFFYSPVDAVGDPIQVLIQQSVDRFTFVKDKSPREVAAVIQKDDLDILLELNGFTTGSRVEALAYRPAPVQMSWLGYPFSCGLKAIDHVVLDHYVVDPEGEKYLVEEPVHMPEAWVCFGKFAEIEIQPGIPLDRHGRLTFGTQNNVYKYTAEMIAQWARVMTEVPDSRFLVVRPEADSLVICKNISEQFERNGVSPDRLYFFNNRNERTSHLSYYNEIDVSLDTFPLTGGTTTCEALWMGVPVVSLVGDAFHQRISYSALMQCGLEELCTFDAATFVERAVEVATDHDRLRLWRHGLREVVAASPLCDQERFVHQFQEMLQQVAAYHNLRQETGS
jgi:predicted O-linked N-acetylglucosamine transferase (SPINDLY family)